jgi:hypothetical protein
MGMEESAVVYSEKMSQYLSQWDKEKHKTSIKAN